MTLIKTKATAAWAAAVLTAGAAIAGCAGGPRSAVVTAVRHTAPRPASAALSAVQGAKICSDLKAWLAGALHEAEPRFSAQLESDENEAGYGALGTDLLALDSNLLNFNSGALRNSPPRYYPVEGLAALQHDCAAYGVSIGDPSA